jgi:putative ABC transport system ATP-binding protein
MIRLQGVARHFMLGEQSVHALAQVNLHINAGEYVAVMGPSGSGKSTLLNVLGLLDRPDAGHYLLDGIDTAGLGEPQLAELRSRSIGFVFQSFHLIPRLSARENIELPLTLAGMAPAQRRTRVDELLAQLGLGNRAEHKPAELSGGQRQRVAIGRAIAMSPRLLLADEPTGNLDSHSGEEVIKLLERLNQEQGITLVVVTHDPRLGSRARRQVRMADGGIESDSQPQTLEPAPIPTLQQTAPT